MSKLGNLLIGVVGGVIGFVVSGFNPYGAWVGFGLAYGVASIIDPCVPDMPAPGEPVTDLEIMTAIEGSPIPDILGTTKLGGNLLWFGNNYVIETYEEQDTGASGGSASVKTGENWYLSWAIGFCMGPVDTLYTVYFDDKLVWGGNMPSTSATNGKASIALIYGMDRTFLDDYGYPSYDPDIPLPFGMTLLSSEQKLLQNEDFVGIMNFYFGTDDQVIDPDLTALMIAEGTIADETWAIPYRRQCYAVLNDCHVGSYNRCPSVKIVARKAPVCSFDP